MADTPGVSPEVFTLVYCALEAAAGELEAIEETPVPVPNEIDLALRHGAASEAVVRRILRAAPPERRRRLAAMCREERPMAIRMAPSLDQIKTTVLPEVKQEVRLALESVRRAALVDPAVRDALERL
jgi:hypothetical protein